MANELIVIERDMKPMIPHFQEALAGRMPVQRLVRTVLVSLERTPKLLDCTRQSIFNAAMSAAVLGLEVDGITGQAFLIPYGTTAQLVIGYKGMNTLGARSGYTITASAIREGDEIAYQKGTGAFLRHVPVLGSKNRTIGFWSVAESKSLPAIIEVLSIDDILAVKAKSPGAKKSDSPWNDSTIGFPAMGEKTVRRRLSRSMPLNAQTQEYHLAARMEEAFEEQGLPASIGPDRILRIEGTPIAPRENNETPSAETLTSGRRDNEFETLYALGLQKADAGEGEFWPWWDSLTKPQKLKLQPKLQEMRERAEGKVQ